MYIKSLIGLNVYVLALETLFQGAIIPENIYRLLEQYPPLFIVAIVAYYMHKIQREENATNREWLEKMLDIQRTSLRETYDGQNVFLSALMENINNRQDKMNETIDDFRKQLAINTSTVSETSTLVEVFGNRLDKE